MKSAAYSFEWLAIAVFLLATVLFVYVSLAVGAVIRPRQPSVDKLRIYECGEPTIGSAWIRYNIRFYTVALVFLIFDVETVFLFPVVRVFRWFVENGAGFVAFVEILGFLAVLVVGLIYAWRFGNLDWLKDAEFGLMPVTRAAGGESKELPTTTPPRKVD
ncbi:MAG: NADH-quinone oxidoreductase subunit A [Candidatus Sumerlaeaceae bacterium]|nr:NADH-quinone oxidoreductase subunit A [Candidatus Sumerlaeaceae bacterium]